MDSLQKVAKLIVTAGDRPEQVLEVVDRLTIGRSPANQLVLEDQRASRNHADIRAVGNGSYQLTDLGSANGTWLNGQRVAIPRVLADGDVIVIGQVKMRFLTGVPVAPAKDPTLSSGTALEMRHEMVVVLVTDVRSYTKMSQVLPTREFSGLISDWFREATGIIRSGGGTVDKFIGDAVMAYWVAADPRNPSAEVTAALAAAQGLLARAELFSGRLSSEFPGHQFRIGIGLNAGEALHGNVGTKDVQSFTIVGDTVNVAFRLESATKEHGEAVLVGAEVARHASGPFRFRSLGEISVKGRPAPVDVCAVDFTAPEPGR
jgi:adenylate cyclase